MNASCVLAVVKEHQLKQPRVWPNDWGQEIVDGNSVRQTPFTGQETLAQQPQHNVLEEARLRILGLENAEKLMANRACNSEAKLQRAEGRIQELECYALETFNGSQNLEEQLSKTKGKILRLMGQLEQDRVANGKKIEGLVGYYKQGSTA